MERSVWDGFTPPERGQSGKQPRNPHAPGTPGEVPHHSNFTLEQRMEIGQVMKFLRDLAVPSDGEESALTYLITENFRLQMENERIPYFPDVVFGSILDLNAFLAQERNDLLEATFYMLQTAGAEGIGALVNTTNDYLRKALNDPGEDGSRRYRRAPKNLFTKAHMIVNSDPSQWEERDVSEEEFTALVSSGQTANLFLDHCIGEVFTKEAETSIQQAAKILAENPQVRDIAETYDHRVLGSKRRMPIFYNRMGMYQRVLEHIDTLVQKSKTT